SRGLRCDRACGAVRVLHSICRRTADIVEARPSRHEAATRENIRRTPDKGRMSFHWSLLRAPAPLGALALVGRRLLRGLVVVRVCFDECAHAGLNPPLMTLKLLIRDPSPLQLAIR